MAERKSIQDIIQAYCKQVGLEFEPMYVGLSHMLENNTARVMRSGDTLLLYLLTQPHEAEVHLISTEPRVRVDAAVREFYKAMKAAGFKRATANVKIPNLLPLLRRTQVPFSSAGNNRIVIE